MKKKFLSLALALAICLGLCVPALAIELPEGIPTQAEAQDMYRVGWNVDSSEMSPVIGQLKVVGDDRYGNKDTDIFCPGYWPAPLDFMLLVQNISGREDCFLRLYLYFYENDGSGVYRQFDGGVAKLENGQPMDVPDGKSFMYQSGAGEFEGRDVLIALTPQVGFYLPNTGTTNDRSITYSYNAWFFKPGTAEAIAENNDGAEAPEEPEASEMPEAPNAPEDTAAPASPVSAVPTASTVLVNGEATAFDAYNIDGSNYFKLRDLAYVLSGTEKQFEVGWDAAAKAISLTSGEAYTAAGGEMTGKGSGTQTANPSAAKIILDGKEISLTAYEIGGNNYFKLRDIGQTFDFGIGWDSASKTITIDTSTGYTAE